nr:hypothetical protein GCM10020092_031740 [Actinoplanes digitatis]
MALYRLAADQGIAPDYLIGHSIGEVAAAHVAGVFSLADAATLVAARGRLMQALPGGGAMVAVEAAEVEVVPRLSGGVSIAAVNGPSSVVLSGDEDAVAAVVAGLGERRSRRLAVSHAFHSAHMDGMLEEFRAVVAGLSAQAPSLPIVSTVTGALATVDQLTSADYWAGQVRATVRYADGVTWLREHGVTAYLELGPDGTLAAMTRGIVEEATVAAALRAGRPDTATLTAALAELHVNGVPVRWDGWFTGTGTAPADLPTYAFQRRRYWPRGVRGAAAGLGAAHHPLLDSAVSLANSDGLLLTGRLAVRSHPWLADHAVAGTVLLPGTAFLELAVRAGDEVGCDRVEDLTLAAPLALPATGGVDVQLWVGSPDETGRRTLDVYARPEGAEDEPWTPHAAGTLTAGALRTETDAVAPEGAEAIDLTGRYEVLADAGFAYGPSIPRPAGRMAARRRRVRRGGAAGVRRGGRVRHPSRAARRRTARRLADGPGRRALRLAGRHPARLRRHRGPGAALPGRRRRRHHRRRRPGRQAGHVDRLAGPARVERAPPPAAMCSTASTGFPCAAPRSCRRRSRCPDRTPSASRPACRSTTPPRSCSPRSSPETSRSPPRTPPPRPP